MRNRVVVCANGFTGRCGLPVGEWMITPWGLSEIVSEVAPVVRSTHDNGETDSLFPMEGN